VGYILKLTHYHSPGNSYNHWIMRFPGLTVLPSRALSVLALLAAVLALSVPSEAQQDTPRRLEPGRRIDDQLTLGETHKYVILLAPRQYLDATVATVDVDLVAELYAPDGKKLLEVHTGDFPGSPAPVVWVADTAGKYRVEVHPEGKAGGYKIALKKLRTAGSREGKLAEAGRLFNQAQAERRNDASDRALPLLEQALALYGQVNDRWAQGLTLNNLGGVYEALNKSDVAAKYYQQALAVRAKIKDLHGEERTLNSLGNLYWSQSEYETARSYYDRALEIARRAKDLRLQAGILHNIGGVNDLLGKHEKAIDDFEQALQVARQGKNRDLEGVCLSALGWGHLGLHHNDQAIAYFEQALALHRETKNRGWEGLTLANLGIVYERLNKHDVAVRYFEQALAIHREVKNRGSEANVLIDLGWTYANLGEYQTAAGYLEQALAIQREIHNSDGQARALVDLGCAYRGMREYEKAIATHEQALAILSEVKDVDFVGITRKELGIDYSVMGQYEKAAGYFQQSMAGGRSPEPLTKLATAHRHLNQRAKAIAEYQEALALARAVRDRQGEAESLDGLMEAWSDSGQPRLAIFYGKQSVNALQSIRADVQRLDPDLQRTYLKENEKPYHTLAQLLIAQGRLTEAEQVLALLKEEEIFNFLRRDSSESSILNGVAELTPEETGWETRYREIGDRLMAIAAERGDLRAKKRLTADETQRLARLEEDLITGNKAFDKFLGELTQHFSAKPESAARIEQFKQSRGIMEDLRELPAGTVAIYTLEGPDKLSTILVTPDAQKAYEYPIKASDLNRKIFEFRDQAQDPDLDPRPLGRELYNILVAGMAEDLRQAKAQTLMWSLDGSLRYLPINALFDGNNYLIEKYRTAVFTPVSAARMKDLPDRQWSAAGFGVTRAYEDEPALPEVAAELTGIIGASPGQTGVLEGEVKLDDQFTEQAMRNTLLKHYPVVHIASHFQFHPGNETKSFLLLGDGRHLSLAELKSMPNLFGGVQLLTLSACNTGVGDSAGNGTEVEGLGVLAQLQGAKAVIASLWSVADESTSLLMREFYRVRESSPGMPKLEALRQAQLALLRGTVASRQEYKAHRGLSGKDVTGHEVQFTPDPHAPYAHPFFWAPFFLMGNWL
jgi:CHAT domain-containing protein/Tfp pilus assembly protein PilF